MKHIYLAFLLMAVLAFHSQTLTQSFNEPVIGDIDRNYRLDTSAYTHGLPLSVTGNNSTWDFTHLAGAFPMIVDSFISPVGVSSASAYPSASYVQHRDALYSFYKSTANPQQTELLGAYTPSLSITFTNSGIIAGYPVGFGYNISDPVGGNFRYNSTNGVCIGNISISADGLGTLNLPNNVTASNVLRLKSVEILTLSVGIFQFATFNQTIYNYYEPGRKFPIMSLNYTTYQLIAGTPTITAYAYGSNNYFTVVGINQSALNSDNYRAYPNPFHDCLQVSAKDPEEDNELTVYDLNGRLALKPESYNDPNLKMLAPGMYVLEIKNDKGSCRQKIVKD